MRMHGSWHIYRPGERWQRPPREMRVLVGTADFVAVGFNVPDAEFEAARDVGARDAIARLGPGPARAGLRRRRGRAPPAGARRHDDRRGAARSARAGRHRQRVQVGGAVRRRRRAVRDGGDASPRIACRRWSTSRAGSSPPTSAARHRGHGRRTTGRLAPAEGLWVYGRGGRPCRRCGTPISFAKQGFGARPDLLVSDLPDGLNDSGVKATPESSDGTRRTRNEAPDRIRDLDASCTTARPGVRRRRAPSAANSSTRRAA